MGPSDTVKRYVEDEMRSDTPSKAWFKESTVLGPRRSPGVRDMYAPAGIAGGRLM